MATKTKKTRRVTMRVGGLRPGQKLTKEEMAAMARAAERFRREYFARK